MHAPLYHEPTPKLPSLDAAFFKDETADYLAGPAAPGSAGAAASGNAAMLNGAAALDMLQDGAFGGFGHISTEEALAATEYLYAQHPQGFPPRNDDYLMSMFSPAPAHGGAMHPHAHHPAPLPGLAGVEPQHPPYEEYDDDEDDDIDVSHLSKEELRKHKNRQSAARSRKRSRARMEHLERLVQELSEKNERLQHEIRVLSVPGGAVGAPGPLPYYQ